MDKIQTNFWFYPLSLILYSVAYYYILMASINDGISGFLFGIPYALFLLWEIGYLKKESRIKYLHSAILLVALFFLFTDRSQSRFFYPMVGKTYTVANDINYSYGGIYINKIDVYDESYRSYSDEKKPMFRLASGERFRIESQKVTGHPDFRIRYTYKIQSKVFSGLREYIAENLATIKSDLYDDYAKSFSKKKTDYYVEDEKEFYIGSYDLQALMESQGLPYKEQNIETLFTNMSFYLLLYPVILVLFFVVLAFRNSEIFYRKNRIVK